MDFLHPIMGIRLVKDAKSDSSASRAEMHLPKYSLIASPDVRSAGALMYNTDNGSVYVSTGSAWVQL